MVPSSPRRSPIGRRRAKTLGAQFYACFFIVISSGARNLGHQRTRSLTSFEMTAVFIAMYNANSEEQEILKFWEKDKTFEKSVESRSESKPYVFYDGPPFATGLPHYGHIVASTMKDIVPRYFAMKGYRVERRWGWDCHGLPIENIIEKDLNLNSRRDIETYGIANFNEACRATVLKYAEEWKKTIRRMGRWVDMENDYKTMDPSFMESVWWVFRSLWDRGLIYKSHKAMHMCPRCATTLSNFEVTQGYKDVKDLSATAKFKLKENNQTKELFMHAPGPFYVLAWTTTPWTLPGNVLLAVGHDITYLLVKTVLEDNNPEYYLVAKERAPEVFKDKPYEVVDELKGSRLSGLEYEPLFSYYADTRGAFRVVTGDFVTTEDGTGIVHIAPGFGEDDYALGKREGLPLVQHVNMEGKFVDAVTGFAGMDVKPKDDPSKADVEIIKWLAHNGKLFSKQKYEHSYPHCWRCDTPLLNYATTSWFVRVTDMKEQLLKNNTSINWVPEHIKEGRFGKWLEGARDWAISRSRYWGTPLPVWEGPDGEVICVGSIEELEKLTGEKVVDLHKHLIDKLVIIKDGKEYKRIPEVLDCWFESGSMPYGQMHYPFENKEKFEAAFPAEFIAEGQDQTRGWFYTLHILASALTGGKEPAIKSCGKSVPAFKNVIVNGIVLAEDGKKMSKKLKNYPDPEILLEKYGADAMRFYLASSPVMEAESLNFSEAGVREMFSKVVNTLYNVLEFYQMFAAESEGVVRNSKQGDHVLDKWILAKLHTLVSEVTQGLESYRLADASRPVLEFITELSQWYVRRSRDRFKGDDEADKARALGTLQTVLATLSKLMAPFTPFVAEKVWQTVGESDASVHLETWPEADSVWKDDAVLEDMAKARKVVELGLALRAETGIKVRQVLAEFSLVNVKLSDELKAIVADELNVKRVMEGNVADPRWIVKEDGGMKVALDTEVTESLRKEGMSRDLIRHINQVRKEQKLTINDRVKVTYNTENELLNSVFQEFVSEIAKATLADEVVAGEVEGEEAEIAGEKAKIAVTKLG